MNPPVRTLAFLFTISVSSQAATIGHWEFDGGPDGSPATMVPDSSGNGNVATANNGPLYSSAVPNGSGHSIALNGLNQTVAIPAAAGPLASAGSFTVEFWMRSSAQASGQDLLVDKSHGFSDSTGWLFQTQVNSGVVYFGIGAGGGGNVNFPGINSLADLYDGEWHHLAGTYDSGTSAGEFFVDGVSQGTFGGTYVSNNRDIRLGNTWQSSRFFEGSLDELRISDQVLSPSEFLIAVPEPSAVVLALVGMIGMLPRRR